MDIQSILTKKLKERAQQATLRKLSVSHPSVDFLSNDYLGLARSSKLKKNIEVAYNKLPAAYNGATGSRLLSGNSKYAEALEADLATIFKAEKTLLFNAGYVANLALLSAVPQRGDTIVLDELAHVCMKEGARLSFAHKLSFRHNDLDDLEKKLQKAQGMCFVVVESVYSMDGDVCPLESIVLLCKRYKAYLIVDEAHSTGIWGKQGNGLACDLGLEEDIFARVYTFGKAMGVHGAIVAGSDTLIQYLINFARPFIYTTALPIHSLVSIREAFAYLGQNPLLQNQLEEKIAYFKSYAVSKLQAMGVPVIDSKSAIQALVISGAENAAHAAMALQQKGFDVRPILAPTVRAGAERLRICLHSYNTEKEIDGLVEGILTISNSFSNQDYN